jgi:hypothetical protein
MLNPRPAPILAPKLPQSLRQLVTGKSPPRMMKAKNKWKHQFVSIRSQDEYGWQDAAAICDIARHHFLNHQIRTKD